MDDIFKDLPVDAKTAGDAVGEVNTKFGLTGDELEGVTKQFLEFAEVNNTDVVTSIESTQSIMKKFGVDTKDTNLVLGKMTSTSQKTGISMDTLETSLETNGSTLKEMGLTLGESVDLLGSFEKSGIDSSKAMTSLKKAQQKAVKEGKSLGSTLKSAVSRIKSAKTETEALQIATDVFGKQGAAEMTQAIREGRLALDEIDGSMTQYANTVEDTYNATIDPWDEMKTSVNNLKLAGAELADQLFKVLKPIIDQVVASVKEFTSWFSSLSESQQQMIVKIGLLVAAAGPLLIIGGQLISSVGSIVDGAGKLITSAGSIVHAISKGGGLIATIGSLVSSAAPLLIGGAIVAGIIAAVVLIVKNWGKIKAAAKALKTNVINAWKKMTDGISKAWKSVKEATGNAWKNVKQTVSNAMKSVTTTTSSALTKGKQSVKNAWESMKTTTSNAMKTLKNTLSTGWTSVKNTTATAWTNIRSTISKQWTNIRIQKIVVL
jgi:phage-related minor tail protein